jgi:hypothetical protein
MTWRQLEFNGRCACNTGCCNQRPRTGTSTIKQLAPCGLPWGRRPAHGVERLRQLAGCYRGIAGSPRCSKISRKVFEKLCPFVRGNSQPIADHLVNGGVPSVPTQSGCGGHHAQIVALLASPGHHISIWPVRQIARLRDSRAERCDGECESTKQQGPSSHQTASLFSRVEMRLLARYSARGIKARIFDLIERRGRIYGIVDIVHGDHHITAAC